VQYRSSSFFLCVDRVRIDRLLFAPAALFSNYFVQIVAFFHRIAKPETIGPADITFPVLRTQEALHVLS
jgi:hypothetical protein